MSQSKIRIKILSTLLPEQWLHQLPKADNHFGNCEFIFDAGEPDYDWLVVYDDLPRPIGQRISKGVIDLRCPVEQTILFTTEPASIKTYGWNYTQQFGHVVTSQSAFALPHKKRHYTQASLHWFYGLGQKRILSYEQICQPTRHENKDKLLSVVWSDKREWHTAHHQRRRFLRYLREKQSSLDIFGRDKHCFALDDKAEALDRYRYHIAIENAYDKHHWTEKLADSYLGLCLPFYYGCPNLDDYFPSQSYIAIDIFKPHQSLEVIRQAIHDGEYEKRLTAIKQAKQRLLNDYNIFAAINQIVSDSPDQNNGVSDSIKLYARRSANRKSKLAGFIYLLYKGVSRLYCWSKCSILLLNYCFKNKLRSKDS